MLAAMNPVLIFRKHGNTSHPGSLRRHSLCKPKSRIAPVAVYFTPEHPFMVIVPPIGPDIRQDSR
jgi:hypothetical protein